MSDPLFGRLDESPDPAFYVAPRRVTHIDEGAIATVTALYGELLPAAGPVLDLMSSWRSHLPREHPRPVVGLGLNREEMADNPQLDEVVVHDLNADPALPFDDGALAAVVCCVSVQYLVRPFDTVAEVARVLRPDGPFVVTFSNRCFPSKAVAAWRAGDDEDHLLLVDAYFRAVPGFGPSEARSHRPGWGDPVYAVWARRLGPDPQL
jgi:SAM-dependent methyltransferase